MSFYLSSPPCNNCNFLPRGSNGLYCDGCFYQNYLNQKKMMMVNYMGQTIMVPTRSYVPAQPTYHYGDSIQSPCPQRVFPVKFEQYGYPTTQNHFVEPYNNPYPKPQSYQPEKTSSIRPLGTCSCNKGCNTLGKSSISGYCSRACKDGECFH